MATAPIVDLKLSASGPQSSFNTAHLLPHGFESAEMIKAVGAAASLHNLQKMVGEDPTKMNKVTTKTVVTSVIRSERQIVTACANATVLTHTLVDHDVVDLDPSKSPFLHLAARKLAVALTSTDCVEYMSRYACNACMHYYAFGLLNRTHCIFLKVLKDEGAIRAAMPRNSTPDTSAINVATFKMANNTLNKGIDTLIEVFSNAKELEKNTMYLSSIFSEESQKEYAASINKRTHDTLPVDPDNKSKRQKKKELKDAAEKRAPKIGPLICATKSPIHLPTEWPTGETPLCPALLRHGSKGCTRKGCQKSHQRINGWSKALIKFMIGFVSKTDDISWNLSVATPDILGLKLT